MKTSFVHQSFRKQHCVPGQNNIRNTFYLAVGTDAKFLFVIYALPLRVPNMVHKDIRVHIIYIYIYK